MDSRPPIPTEIRRRVLVEAGHRCAIPTCRYIEIDVHHIIPWANCHTHEYSNLIALCPNCHRRTHKGDIDRKSLRLYKLNLRFVHDKYSQLEMDIMFELGKMPQNKGLYWQPVLFIFLKRIMESGFIVELTQHQGIQTHISSGGMDMSPKIIVLSPKGRALIDELGIHEM